MKSKFYLYDPKAKNESGIFAWVSFGGKRERVPTGESINPKHWNPKKHEARTSLPESPELNERLLVIASTIKKTYLAFKNENEGCEPAPEIFKAKVAALLAPQKFQNRVTFFSFFQSFVDRQKEGLRINVKKGTPIKPEAAKHYQHTLNTLKQFNPKLDFKDISLAFYNDLLKDLNSKNIALNTIGAHIQRLKAVLAEAEAKQLPVNKDYKSKYFARLSEDTENIALTPAELEAVQILDLSKNKGLEAVRDLFVVGCYTGMRWSDYSTFKVSDIANGFIKIRQVKTQGKVTIPVHDAVNAIIQKYNGSLPKSVANQPSNDYLKEICKMVAALHVKESKTTTRGGRKVTVIKERWELVSTHTARRTFATTQYNKGVPSLTIMAITGHKTEKDFLKYIKVSPDEHAIKMQNHWADEKRSKLKAV